MIKNIINEQITAKYKQIMLIDTNGKLLGIIDSKDALEKAYNNDLDLICVSENQKTPVCKILNYSKYQYSIKKTAKQQKSNTSSAATVQFTCRISDHDYQTKLLKAQLLLQQNKSVILIVKCTFRELRLINTVAIQIIKNAIQDLRDYSTSDECPKIEGKIVKITLNPKKTKKS